MLEYRSHRSCTKFGTKFLPICYFYLVQMWTYKNADGKAHIFSWRSKNVKKAGEKRIVCKFTFTCENRFNPFDYVSLITLRFKISCRQKRMTLCKFSCRMSNAIFYYRGQYSAARGPNPARRHILSGPRPLRNCVCIYPARDLFA